MDTLIKFILDTLPVGVVVYDKRLRIVFRNNRAEKILSKYSMPDDVQTVTGRIFSAMAQSKLREKFPGEIIFTRKLDNSPSRWTFRFHISDETDPFVCIYIYEETASSKFDIDTIRRQYNLTRRENDVLRRVLDGLKNVEIARELGISEQTVKDHLSSIYAKIGVQQRFSLLQHLMNTSEITPPQ